MANNHIQNETGTFKDVYTDQHWLQLAYAYLLYGSMKKAADEVGVPYSTATKWKREKPEKWMFFVEKAQEKMWDKTVGAMNAILKKAMALIEKTLDEGEQRVTKDGSVVHVRPPLAAQNAVMGTVADKLHRIRRPGESNKPPKRGKRDLRHHLGKIGRGEETSDEEMVH